MRKGSIFRVLIAIFLFTALAFSEPQLSQAQQSSSSPVHTGPMPDTFFYSHIFRHILYLQDNGEPPLVAGTQTASIADFYTSRVGMTVAENTVLLSTARAWKAEVDPVDAEAHNLIEAIHARTPGGRLASGETPPPVPQGLTDLQQKRDAITLKHVAALRQSFGDARFLRIDSSLRRTIHVSLSGPKPIQAKNSIFTH